VPPPPCRAPRRVAPGPPRFLASPLNLALSCRSLALPRLRAAVALGHAPLLLGRPSCRGVPAPSGAPLPPSVPRALPAPACPVAPRSPALAPVAALDLPLLGVSLGPPAGVSGPSAVRDLWRSGSLWGVCPPPFGFRPGPALYWSFPRRALAPFPRTVCGALPPGLSCGTFGPGASLRPGGALGFPAPRAAPWRPSLSSHPGGGRPRARFCGAPVLRCVATRWSPALPRSRAVAPPVPAALPGVLCPRPRRGPRPVFSPLPPAFAGVRVCNPSAVCPAPYSCRLTGLQHKVILGLQTRPEFLPCLGPTRRCSGFNWVLVWDTPLAPATAVAEGIVCRSGVIRPRGCSRVPCPFATVSPTLEFLRLPVWTLLRLLFVGSRPCPIGLLPRPRWTLTISARARLALLRYRSHLHLVSIARHSLRLRGATMLDCGDIPVSPARRSALRSLWLETRSGYFIRCRFVVVLVTELTRVPARAHPTAIQPAIYRGLPAGQHVCRRWCLRHAAASCVPVLPSRLSDVPGRWPGSGALSCACSAARVLFFNVGAV